MSIKLSEHDEQRLRNLAIGMAQGIREPNEILKELGFDEDDWRELEQSRTFKRMLAQAQAEWNAASGTGKRVRLKAGVNIELALPQFYQDMVDTGHPLGARVRLLEAMTALSGIATSAAGEAVQQPGAQFKLEIHLGDRVDVVSIGAGVAGALPASPLAINQHESFKLPDWLVDSLE